MPDPAIRSESAVHVRQVVEAYLEAVRGAPGPGGAFDVAVDTYRRLQGTEITLTAAFRAVAAILATHDT